MKKTYTVLIAMLLMMAASAQNYNAGPAYLAGTAWAAQTAIDHASPYTGAITVGNGGNWTLGGNITSKHKSNSNNYSSINTAVEQLEVITFSGTGTYSGAQTTALGTGNAIDGYAAIDATTTGASFVLPLGNATTAFPMTVPVGSPITAAYYDGGTAPGAGFTVSGTPNVFVNKPFYDVQAKVIANYTLSYPAGLVSMGHDAIVYTTTGSSFLLSANLPATFFPSGGTVTANLAGSGNLALFFATNASVAVAVNFISFRATPQQGSVLLNWNVGQEDNTKQYLVMRSADGSNWQSIGTVAATSSTAYRYTDTNPLSGKSYYRIAEVDNSTKQTFSEIRLVNESTGAITVLPTITTGIVMVRGNAAGLSNINVIDQLGHVLITVRGNGSTAVQVDLSRLSKGWYYIYTLNSCTKVMKE